MRMSVLSYLTLGLAAAMVLFTYIVNRDPGFLRLALPLLLVLIVIPLLMTWMNRRQTDRINMHDYKLCRIKELHKMENGTPVRLRGTVESSSLRWLNRPYYQLNDGSGKVGVFMFAAPRENIQPGDSVEAAGTVRYISLFKTQKVWGVKMEKREKVQR